MKKIVKIGFLALSVVASRLQSMEQKNYTKTVDSVYNSLLEKTSSVAGSAIDCKTTVTGTIVYNNQYDEKGNSGHTITFLLIKNSAPETPIGFVEFYYKPKPNIFYIADLSVDEKYRHKGFGSVLMEMTISLAKKFAQKTKVEVNLIPAARPDTMQEKLVNFYSKKFGFGPVEPDSRQRLYL